MIIRTQVLIPFVLLATAGCDRGGAEDALPQQEAAKVADVTRAATPGDARTKPVVPRLEGPRLRLLPRLGGAPARGRLSSRG